MNSNQLGRSMIEMVLVIGIIGALGISLMNTISNVYTRYKANAIVWEVKQLQKNINAYFSATGYYDGLKSYVDTDKMKDVDKLVSEKIVPPEMRTGNHVIHSASGQVIFYPVDTSKADRTCTSDCIEYEMSFDNVPKRECIELAMINWSHNDTSDLIGVKFNEGNYIEWPMGVKQNNVDYLPITLTVAARVCSEDKNKIIWWFQ